MASEHQTTLLPCPFCGQSATVTIEVLETTDYENHLVECDCCTAQIEEATRERAIVAWNRRMWWPENDC